MGTETAFGVSRLLERDESEELRRFLEEAWSAQFNSLTESVEADLTKLRRWFRPDHKLSNLRAQAVTLAPMSSPPPAILPEACFVRLGGSRGLVTPEGRALLELLRRDGEQIDAPSLHEVTAAVTEFYGHGYRAYLARKLMGGDSRPTTTAFLFFLLLNGSIGPQFGVKRPSVEADERRAMQVIATTIEPIALAIGGKPIPKGNRAAMKGNWILTESSAQFPFLVAHDEHGYWIRPEAAEEFPQRLAARIGELQKPPSVAELDGALAEATRAYRDARPTLAALELTYQRPEKAERGIKQIISAYRRLGP